MVVLFNRVRQHQRRNFCVLCTAIMQRPDFAVSLSQLINQAGLADMMPTSPASCCYSDHAAVAAAMPPETRDHCTWWRLLWLWTACMAAMVVSLSGAISNCERTVRKFGSYNAPQKHFEYDRERNDSGPDNKSVFVDYVITRVIHFIIIIYWQNTAVQQCSICRQNRSKHYVLKDRKAKWISTYNCPLKIQ